MEIIFFIFLLIGIFFIIGVLDYMKKSLRQREDQIAQMDRFFELYKTANGLNPVGKNNETDN